MYENIRDKGKAMECYKKGKAYLQGNTSIKNS